MLPHLLRAALALGSTAAAVLTAESVHRALTPGPHDPDAVVRELERLVDPTEEFLADVAPRPGKEAMLHPFVGAQYGHDRGGVIAHFEQDLEPELARLILVGGSVASSIEKKLQRVLDERLPRPGLFGGRRVRVLNLAHPTFKQPQQLHRLTHLMAMGHVPDLVVNVDGFNELALSLQSTQLGVHPTFPSPPLWPAVNALMLGADDATLDDLGRIAALEDAARSSTDRFTARGLARSSLLSARQLATARSNWVQRYEIIAHRFGDLGRPPHVTPDSIRTRQLQGPAFDDDFDAVMAACVENWFQSNLSIDAILDARDVPYLHVLQPTLHDEGAKPISPEEQAFEVPEAWISAPRAGYPLMRARLPELVAAGVASLDATRLFVDATETLYVDGCHYGHEGQLRLAVFAVDALLELASEKD